jgi:hypothetical protein
MKNNARTIALVIFLFVLAASFAPAQTSSNRSTFHSGFPVTVYFSLEAGTDPLNVEVSMDGNTFINQEFTNSSAIKKDTTTTGKVRYIEMSSKPVWPFQLVLKEGIHQIMASSKNGDAGLDVVFTVEKPLWLILSYWGKNHFQLNIGEQPANFQ